MSSILCKNNSNFQYAKNSRFLHGKMLILRHESERHHQGVLAGICISFGGTIYLRVGGVAGAVLFAFGLIAVITSGLNLFTGKSQFVWGRGGATDGCSRCCFGTSSGVLPLPWRSTRLPPAAARPRAFSTSVSPPDRSAADFFRWDADSS